MSGAKDAHVPLARIQFIISNLLVRAISFGQAVEQDCHIDYTRLDGKREEIAGSISTDNKTFEPCSITAVLAKFTIPPLTRDELVKRSEAHTAAKLDVIPSWRFVIDGTTQEMYGWSAIPVIGIPNIS